MSYLVTTHRPDRSGTISRFTPRFWTLDMPLEVSGSIRTTGASSIRADCVFRRNRDLAGVMWHTDHPFDHPRFKYAANGDYTGLIWTFDISLAGDCPRLDALYGATLVIDTADGASYNVRLWNYRTNSANSNPYQQSFRIPFTQDLYSGYAPVTASTSEAEKAARRVPVNAISRIMLPITPRDYLGGEATLGAHLLPGALTATIVMPNGAIPSPGDVITVPTAGGGIDLTIAGDVAPGGQPVAHGSDWGDVVFSWTAPAGSSGPTYEVSVQRPEGTWTVLGTTSETWFDFPVEDSIPLFGAPPASLAWRVKVVGELTPFVDASSPVTVDNAFVTMVVPFLGQSNASGHFTALSGGTRATCSAGTFRRKLASLYGIRPVRVMPLEACWAASAADKMGEDDLVFGTNYWWDLATDQPGPRLTQAVGIINAVGKPAVRAVWAQGEQDIAYMDPSYASRYPTQQGYTQPSVARLKQAWEKIFAYLRSHVSGALEIYVQKLSTSWYGAPPAPVLPDRYSEARTAQEEIVAADPLTYMGALNRAVVLSDFTQEGLSYLNYAGATYHALANELAEAIHTHSAGDGAGAAPGLGSAPSGYDTTAIVAHGGGVYTVRTTRFFTGLPIPAGTRVNVRTQANSHLAVQNECSFTLSNMAVSGAGTLLDIELRPEPAHPLAMTDGYDNCYNLTPEFVAERTWTLGYRGPYVLYMGISHLHNFRWTGSRWLLDKTGELVNTPTRLWFEDFCRHLRQRGYDLWVSVSYEILASIMPNEWMQVNADGVQATTGWSPPSGLVEPSNMEAAAYLANVAKRFLGIARDNGLAPKYQIGEPWWWDGSFTDGKPCVYSFATLTKYHEDTGLYAPEPRMTSTRLTPEDLALHRPYLEWLGRQLGESTNRQIEIVKAAFPEVQTAILVFTPQVLNPVANASAIMNLPPVDQWGPSKFDVLMIEDYDWVTGDYNQVELGQDRWALMKRTWTMARDTLGYPLSRIFYFSGFVLEPEDAWKWAYIDAAVAIGLKEGAARTFVWSREQVLRDGFIYQRRATPTVSIQTNARVI